MSQGQHCCENGGRYLTDRLQRHWSSNRGRFCLLPACPDLHIEGDLQHFLLSCRSLHQTQERLLHLASRVSVEHPSLHEILNFAFSSPDPSFLIQLLLDSSSVPSVIKAVQVYGLIVRDRLLYLGRTWCYTLHRERMNQLGLIKFR